MSLIPEPEPNVFSSGDDDDELSEDAPCEQLAPTPEGKRKRKRKRKKRQPPQDNTDGAQPDPKESKNKIGGIVSNSGHPMEALQGSTPPPKKKRRTRTRSSMSNVQRNLNGSHLPNSNPTPFKPKASTSQNGDSLTPNDTIEPFSIYRIEVTNVPLKPEDDTQNLQLLTIKNIMEKINTDAIAGHRSPYQFYEGKLQLDNLPPEQGESTKPPCNYEVCAYIQEHLFEDKFLPHIGIQKGFTGIQKLVFFYRPSEIFVLSFGQPCQAIQPYCCAQFSSQIAARLVTIDAKFQTLLKSLHSVHTSRALPTDTHSNPTRVNTMGYNWVKDIRPDASIFRLKEFTSRHPTQGNDSCKLRFDMRYVRIMTRIKVLHLPEILAHFGTICRGEPTYKYPSGESEEHVDLFPSVVSATKETSQKVDQELHKRIYDFMHQPNCKSMEFELCPKLTEGFTMPITLTYNNVTVDTFLKCPTAYEVFDCLRRICPELMDTKDESFAVQIKKCKLNMIRDNKRVEHVVLDLLEGVIPLGEECFWKTMGAWSLVRDEYHQKVHMEFINLLKKTDILFKPGDVPLEAKWSGESVTDYVQSYRNMDGYFVPNTPQMFDLMRIGRHKNGTTAVFLYYIVERFDAGIGSVSKRINKSLDMMFNQQAVSASTSTPNDRMVTDEKSLLEEFYHSQFGREEFSNWFPTWSHFYHVVQEKVCIVVAFRTLPQEGAQLPKTFVKERDLEVVFTLQNVFSLIVCNLDFVTKQGVCMELGVDPDDNRELASKILDALVSEKYCSEDGKVSGKLLKLRCAQEFQIFSGSPSSSWLNVKVFEYIQPYFVSQFLGFIPKLECFEIHERVAKNPRLCLKFTEVAGCG